MNLYKLMNLKNIYPKKIPKEILEDNHVDDIILYALGTYGPLLKAEFNQINKTTFYKYLNKLIDKNFVFPPERKRRMAIYEITPLGQAELMRRLGNYNLNFYEMIELEKKKIRGQVMKLSSFFEKYKISDDLIKIEYLSLYNTLVQVDTLSIFSKEKFNKLLLYIVLNDLHFFKETVKVLSIGEFIDEYDIDHQLTKTDIQMFIQEVVDKNRYGIEIFKLFLNEESYLFFRADSEFGIFFETIVKKHLWNLNYLKCLNNSEIYESDLEEIIKSITYVLIKKYQIFNPELEEQIFHLSEDYITNLQLKLHEKPVIEFNKMGDFLMLYSPYIGYTYPFKPLTEEDERQLVDIRTTFQRIREKEPKNKQFWSTLEFFFDDKFEEALIEVNKCLELDSEDYYAIGLKSKILYKLGQYGKALKIFEEALKLKPHSESTVEKVEIKTNKAELLLALKRYDEALNIIKKEIPMVLEEYTEIEKIEFYKENYIEFQFFKLEATIYYEQNKFDEALNAINQDLEYLEKFIGMDDNEVTVEGYLLKSKILYNLRKFEESLEEIKKALKIKPNNPDMLYQSAKIYEFISPINSFYELNKALNIKPNNEKIRKQYDNYQQMWESVLIASDLTYHITNKMYEILNKNKIGLNFEELNQKLLESDELKKYDIDDYSGMINHALETNDVIINDVSDLLQISDEWESISNKFDNVLTFSKNISASIRLIDIFQKNDWNELSLELLILKLSGNEFLDNDFVISFINNFTSNQFLIKSKGNLVGFNQKEFEKQLNNTNFFFGGSKNSIN